jgi:hypothetical protein
MTADLVEFPKCPDDAGPDDPDDPMLAQVPYWYSLACERQAPIEFAEDAGRMLQLYAKLSMTERHMLDELIKAFGRIARGEERGEA